MSILTIKVIKSHDGIQQGAVLRFAENPVIRQMIADGYYQLVKTEETKIKAGNDDEESAVSKAVKNFKKRLRK